MKKFLFPIFIAVIMIAGTLVGALVALRGRGNTAPPRPAPPLSKDNAASRNVIPASPPLSPRYARDDDPSFLEARAREMWRAQREQAK